ncbi:MAG TPA: hypothetical protein VIT65_15135 [Microlunatus sp.]
MQAQVDPSSVARFAADAERGRALAGDFGDPQVTDLGRTRVWLHGSRGEQQVSIYALPETYDEDTSGRRRRRRLRGLIDDAYALVGDAGTPYVPPGVVVLELRVDPEEGPPRCAGRVRIPRSSSTGRGRGAEHQSPVESSPEARLPRSTPQRRRTTSSDGWSAARRGCSW